MGAKRRKRGHRRPGPIGPVKVRRGATVHRRGGHDVLSREAEERLFEHSEVLSEGRERSSKAAPAWFGSTMITIDLDRFAEHWRGRFDGEARERLERAVAGSVRVRLRAMRMARAFVARRLPDRLLGTAEVDTRVRVVGDKLHLDVDIEVPLDVSSARGRR